jgi:peptidoglycan/xylan/chitin deacetylase (PgdA/CDA1 family)
MTDVLQPSSPAGRAVLVRRGYVGDFEVGERPMPQPDRLLRWGRFGLLPVSSVLAVATPEPVLSLTYDDGPDPEFTGRVLDLLAEHGARATFFLLTERARRHPALVARMLAEGHEVGLHGIDHARLTRLSAPAVFRLLRAGKDQLEQVTGRPARLYRPTYGAQSVPQFLAARALGLEVVIWSAWARDWEGAPAEVVGPRAVTAMHAGAIVLLHDSSGDGVGIGLDRGRASELVLAGMRGRGFASVPAGELLARYPAVRTYWVDAT